MQTPHPLFPTRAPQEGDTAYIRINFNFGPSYEPGMRYPRAIFVKELSYRSADSRHAAKVGGREQRRGWGGA